MEAESSTPTEPAVATTPSSPTKPLASAPKTPEPPNTIPAPAPDSSPTVPPTEPSREQKLAALCETTFLRIQELPGAVYSHRGYCTKCGWQSMQHSAEAAHQMTSRHVMVHWRDVAAGV